jgi:hypothetical protein
MKEDLNPEDLIKRALLLMKYDMKDTLTENEEKVTVPNLNEDTTGVALGSATGGAAVGAGVAAAGLLPGTAALTGLGGTAFSIGSTLGSASIGATSALALGGAVLGGAAALAILPLAYWLITKDGDKSVKVKKLFRMCSTNRSEIGKLPRKINDLTIRGLSDEINDALNYQTLGMAGTDEEALYDVFRSLTQGTASDACELLNRYNREYGDLYEDLDSDIDSEDEWNQIYRPLRNCVEDSLLHAKNYNPCSKGEIWDVNKKSCVKITKPSDDELLRRAKACGHKTVESYKNSGWKCTKGGSSIINKSMYKECNSFPYTKYCKSPIVKEVQKCLGVTDDSYFGPITDDALFKQYGTHSLTQSIYKQIMNKCKGGSSKDTSSISNDDILQSTPSTDEV